MTLCRQKKIRFARESDADLFLEDRLKNLRQTHGNMTSRFFILLVAFSLFSQTTLAADAKDDTGKNPGEYIPFWHLITQIPQTAWTGLKAQWDVDAIPGWALMLGSSAVLYHYDEDISSDIKAKGRAWGYGNSEHTKTMIKIGDMSIFRGPTDTASWLYFLGDGTIPIVASVAFVGTGYFDNNSHAWNTGIVMANGLLTASIFDQLIKHTAGRQSPSMKTENRGKWQPFPNLKSYAKSTSSYDAMPSGHIMTATLMWTVLEEEYPEYNYIFYPAEVAWLATLGFGMINNDVHWASDYPLGIALGYIFGRAAMKMHKPNEDKTASHINFFPGVDPDSGSPTLNALYTF
jgi:hypothetical protein